jgi:hypothetical protein
LFSKRRGPEERQTSKILPSLPLSCLLCIPAAAYVLSYVYLAVYHRRFWLLSTVVHEGGEYTLLETILYASHFIGHIPVITTLAFLFVGSSFSISTGRYDEQRGVKIGLLASCLVLFVLISFLISFQLFGVHDTLIYLGQGKQSLVTYGEGGSWNLHLPSTILLFLLVPVYIYVFKVVYLGDVTLSASGLPYLAVSLLLAGGVTALVNPDVLAALGSIWTGPRYMGHSVRDLLTFPVTYFPIALYFIMKREQTTRTRAHRRLLFIGCGLLALLFLCGLAYQSAVVLRAGIGDTAQKPSFARDGKLTVAYLLSSHYFEHVLDTVYFSLLSVLLFKLKLRNSDRRRQTDD